MIVVQRDNGPPVNFVKIVDEGSRHDFLQFGSVRELPSAESLFPEAVANATDRRREVCRN